MDPATLQLFSPEEILDRLGQKKATGCFHLFTAKESANIFLKEGIVTASICGQTQGVDVLQQIASWRDVHYVWHPEAIAPAMGFKPLHIPIREFLAQQRGTSAPPTTGATLGRKGSPQSNATSTLPNVTSPSPQIHHSIPAKGKMTGALPVNELPPPSAPVQLAATKSFNPGLAGRTEEELLLQKHRFTLVSTENPETRYKIGRVSGLIGRNPACDISIQHASISRQHCLIQLSDRGLHVKDLGTTNGTKVNGIALTEGYVSPGDKLMIGHITFLVAKE